MIYVITDARVITNITAIPIPAAVSIFFVYYPGRDTHPKTA